MNLERITTLTDEQVSATIRYLDPDLNDPTVYPERRSYLILVVIFLAELIAAAMILNRW